MPLVKISLLDHWSQERTREAVYREICREVGKLEIAPEDICIQIIEQPDINWGFGGKSRKSQNTK